jgi:hypothetical protein
MEGILRRPLVRFLPNCKKKGNNDLIGLCDLACMRRQILNQANMFLRRDSLSRADRPKNAFLPFQYGGATHPSMQRAADIQRVLFFRTGFDFLQSAPDFGGEELLQCPCAHFPALYSFHQL